jgi:hypothetical protein
MKLDLISFVPEFLHAFLQNLWLGVVALVIGLVLGLPLARITFKSHFLSKVVNGMVVFLRDIPVFIVMYIALGILKMTTTIADTNIFSMPVCALLIGLSFSSVSSVFDAAVDSIKCRNAGKTREAMLIIPNIFRVFVSVATTTSVGAALGVKEAVSFSLTTAERMTNPADRLVLVLCVSLFFVVFVLLMRWLINISVKNFARV